MATLTAKHKPYPSYKPSGVDWLGDVPAHWEVKRLKSVCRFAYGDSLPFEARTSENIPVYGSNGVVGFHSLPNTNGKCLIIGRKGSFGKVHFSSGSAFAIDTTFFVDSRTTDANIRWLYYLLHSLNLDAVSKDSAVPGLSRDDAYQQVGFCPPLAEQRAIAAFLDRETAKIDALISKSERLIELLQEKRTVLISHTVTKGLDPNTPMKESGVEWLGEIPAHWEVKRLKHLGDLQGGAGFPHEEQWDTTQEYPFFKVGDMSVEANQREMIEYQHTVSSDTARRLRAYIFPPFTIVFAKVGAALMLNRRRMIVRPSCIDNNMMGFIPRVPDPDWMLYWMSGLDLRKLANPGAVPSVNEGQIREQETTLPPLVEQTAIAAFLDQETAKLDNLIAKVHQVIELLKELRAALISAAVTGQIDVREETVCT